MAICDVMVVGGGPAGLAAALAAGRAGARVVLVDEQSELGGSLLSERDRTHRRPSRVAAWVAAATARTRCACRKCACSRARPPSPIYDAQHAEPASSALTDHVGPTATGPRQRLWRIRAKEVILATGADRAAAGL